jgi:hypothetical protein
MRKIGRKHIRSVTREIGKVAKSVLHDVLLPEGKQALKEEIQHARRRKDVDFQTPVAEMIVEDAIDGTIDGKGLYAGRGVALGPQMGSPLLKMDNPALRSQPYSANFAMNAQLPPQYVRGGVRFV